MEYDLDPIFLLNNLTGIKRTCINILFGWPTLQNAMSMENTKFDVVNSFEFRLWKMIKYLKFKIF